MANGSPERVIESQCVLGNDNRRRISTAERDHTDLEQRIEKEFADVWSVINQLRDRLDRLPAWAVLMISGLSAITGAAVSVAIAAAL